jgi:hypothetical protein
MEACVKQLGVRGKKKTTLLSIRTCALRNGLEMVAKQFLRVKKFMQPMRQIKVLTCIKKGRF